MKKLLVMILCIIVTAIGISAGEKVYTFSGTITHYDGENRTILASNGKKELSFFITGQVYREESLIDISELGSGCTVTITYLKNRGRLIASKVLAGDCLASSQQ